MANIKPIEATSVHRIQSGQVIIDLCSVVKELVENSLDADATSVEVRFKNQGLDAIEVADNGAGIAKDDYGSVALKHHTSKLRSYDDLAELDTFGFRGEALSSLCALSDLHIVTAQEHEAPKAARLNFAQSGALKDTSTVAAQKGTTVYVETIFKNLPVRRQELTRNIKREYNKVLNLLQAYACISTTARLVVSNVAAKGKKNIVFATKAKQTTRENIANVFGMKTIAALIPLDVEFEMQPSTYGGKPSQVRVSGHVSKPTVGEGRHMADRQLFFVNGRPCALPQVAKVINEVYKTYNLTQSPFIFANMELDTNAYDVNVSPDKRTILLHEQGALLESLRSSLLELFESHQQSVPKSLSSQTGNIPSAFRRANMPKAQGDTAGDERLPTETEKSSVSLDLRSRFLSDRHNLLEDHAEATSDSAAQVASENTHLPSSRVTEATRLTPSVQTQESLKLAHSSTDPSTKGQFSPLQKHQEQEAGLFLSDDEDSPSQQNKSDTQAAEMPDSSNDKPRSKGVIGESAVTESIIPSVRTSPVKSIPGVVPSAFDRMRPLRPPLQQATITIGDKTMTKIIGGSINSKRGFGSMGVRSKVKSRTALRTSGKLSFQNSLKSFVAPGSQAVSADEASEEDDEIEDEDDGNDGDDKHDGAKETLQVNDSEESELENSETRSLHGPDSSRVTRETVVTDKQSDADDEEKSDENSSDGEFIDDEVLREKEEARVAQLIRDAEARAERSSSKAEKRIDRVLHGGGRHATTRLQLSVDVETEKILEQAMQREASLKESQQRRSAKHKSAIDLDLSAEERLTLAVSKDDFKSMRIAGQFNLGFIIACRPPTDGDKSDDELFIIDQHASDEKFNFERLQATTVVQNQTLVNSQRLDLTAVEEEIILDNQDTLIKNGFEVNIDQSGDYPVGKRCTLISLPMSREVTFSADDLEELVGLLSESPAVPGHQSDAAQSSSDTPKLSREASTFSTPVIRPSAVRKMFAMRACRSSIMIGRTLNQKQMRGLVDNMGKMDKPWNCPHGRPTMRHLYSFGKWQGWGEGDGVTGMAEDKDFRKSPLANGSKINWAEWLEDQSEASGASQQEEASEEEEGEEEEKQNESEEASEDEDGDVDMED